MASDGAYINQNWNDHLAGTDGMGHIAHMAERSRRDGAYYFSGIDGSGSDGYIEIVGASSPDDVYFESTAGVIYQMHKHTYGATDSSSGTDIHVINDNATAYKPVTNLNGELTDADGDSMSGKYYNLVFAGVANKTGEYAPVLMNLPTCSYNLEASALADVDDCDVTTLPASFVHESSTGFLIARVTMKHSVAASGTWTVSGTTDLRGLDHSAGGGTTSAQTDFPDNAFTVFDDGDVTKVLAFQASGITTGNTRTVTIQDSSGTMAYSADIHGDGANCAAGEIPLGVDAAGAVEGCYEPTEADITDLVHTTDTGPSPDCGSNQVQDGDGACTHYFEYDSGASAGRIPYSAVAGNDWTSDAALSYTAASNRLEVQGTMRISDAINDIDISIIGSEGVINTPYPGVLQQGGVDFLEWNAGSGSIIMHKSFNATDGGIISPGITFSPDDFTASTTQSQGQGALTKCVANVDVVANDDDVVTLLTAASCGFSITKNSDAAEILQVFPPSGHDLGNGTNASTQVRPGWVLECWADSGSSWSCNQWIDSPTDVAYWSGFDTTGGTAIATPATVTIDTSFVSSSATVFSLASGELTINRTGTFMLEAQCTTTASGTARSESDCWIEEDSGGFAEITGTRCKNYNRISSPGDATTCAITTILGITSGDKIRLRADLTGGTNTVTTLADMSRLTVLEIK